MKSILKYLVILSAVVPYCYSMESINKYGISETKYRTNENQLKIQPIDTNQESICSDSLKIVTNKKQVIDVLSKEQYEIISKFFNQIYEEFPNTNITTLDINLNMLEEKKILNLFTLHFSELFTYQEKITHLINNSYKLNEIYFRNANVNFGFK